MTREDNKLISGFLSRRLSKKDKSLFQKKASTDKAFVKDLVRGIELDEVIDEEFGSSEEQDDETIKGRTSGRKHIIISAIAAVFVLGTFIVGITFFNSDEVKLYDKFFNPLEGASFVTRGTEVPQDVEFSEAIANYYKADYSTSTQQFNEFLSHGNNEPIILLFLGLSYMGNDNHQKAIEVFQVYNRDDIAFIPEIRWYLGLCYLKTGQIEKAILSLESLTSFDGLYGRDSKSLLKKLERLK